MQTPSHGIPFFRPHPSERPTEKRTHNKAVTYESTGEINFARILLATIPGDLYRPLNRGPYGPRGRYIRRVHADRRRISSICARRTYTSAVVSVILITVYVNVTTYEGSLFVNLLIKY